MAAKLTGAVLKNTYKNRTAAVLYPVLLLLVLALPLKVGAAYPGTYDHVRQRAYLIINNPEDWSSGLRFLLAVDFKNRRVKKLATLHGSAGPVSINHNGTILAYGDQNGLHFIATAGGKEIFRLRGHYWRALTWAAASNKAAFYDRSVLVEIDVDKKTVKRVPYGRISKPPLWSNRCRCFLYEDIGHAVYIKGNTVRRYARAKQKDLTASPDRRYFVNIYEGSAEAEEPGVLTLYNYRTEKQLWQVQLQSGFYYQVSWGPKTLRTPRGTVIELKTGKVLAPSKLGYAQYHRYDAAADRKRYVLVWDRKLNRYEVEDAHTGKVVGTYKQFWAEPSE